MPDVPEPSKTFLASRRQRAISRTQTTFAVTNEVHSRLLWPTRLLCRLDGPSPSRMGSD